MTAKARSAAEIRAEIERIEALLPTRRRQYERIAASQRIDTLRWALGESEAW